MSTYFVSDLHLTPEKPHLAMAFLAFLQKTAGSAEAIYVLGDLFEYWIGDDAAELIGAQPILDAMQQASKATPCYFIAGNRDFLVGEQFSRDSGFTVLADETVIDLYGQPTLLLHGDSMCTDDTAHMVFRKEYVTNEARKQAFLSLPIPERIAQAKSARMESHEHKASVSMEIMDVSKETVDNTFAEHQIQQMIHGHTHRQNIHDHHVQGADCQRYVLGDWQATSSVLIASVEGLRIENHPIGNH